MHRQELWLSLDNPVGSLVKIGIDEQSSRRSSSMKLIEGKKIETRTISFRFHFDDVPLYDKIDKAVIELPPSFLGKCDKNGFEEDLANWFLKRMEDREKKSSQKDSSNHQSSDDKKQAIEKLADKLAEMASDVEKLREIFNDCDAFLKHLGITHYVSAIKLGACECHTVTSRSEHKRHGASTSMAARSLAKGGLSGFIEKQFSFKGEEEQKIGRINSDKEVTSEAVIGFEIQPIYKLVRIQYIQMCLRKAIKVYIQSKDNRKLFSPFSLPLIICQLVEFHCMDIVTLCMIAF